MRYQPQVAGDDLSSCLLTVGWGYLTDLQDKSLGIWIRLQNVCLRCGPDALNRMTNQLCKFIVIGKLLDRVSNSPSKWSIQSDLFGNIDAPFDICIIVCNGLVFLVNTLFERSF